MWWSGIRDPWLEEAAKQSWPAWHVFWEFAVTVAAILLETCYSPEFGFFVFFFPRYSSARLEIKSTVSISSYKNMGHQDIGPITKQRGFSLHLVLQKMLWEAQKAPIDTDPFPVWYSKTHSCHRGGWLKPMWAYKPLQTEMVLPGTQHWYKTTKRANILLFKVSKIHKLHVRNKTKWYLAVLKKWGGESILHLWHWSRQGSHFLIRDSHLWADLEHSAPSHKSIHSVTSVPLLGCEN